MFLGLNEANKGASRPKDIPKTDVKKVGILGAGMMGAGIAYSQASRGIASVLKDVSLEKAEHGKAYSAKLTQARVDKGRLGPHDQAELLGRITPTDSAADLQGSDLIIEAVYENMDVKKDIFSRLDKIARPGAVLASNTSYLNINEIAAMTGSSINTIAGRYRYALQALHKIYETNQAWVELIDILEQLRRVGRHVGAQREHRQARGRDRAVLVDVGRVAEGHLAEDRDVKHGFRP